MAIIKLPLTRAFTFNISSQIINIAQTYIFYHDVFNMEDYLYCGLSIQELKQIKEAFDLFDTASTGQLDSKDLKNMFKTVGVDQRKQSMNIMIEQVTKMNIPVDFSSFLRVFTSFFHSHTRENYKKVMRLFDEENNGYISAANLKRVIKQLGLDISATDIQEMISRADSDNDGVISEEEFYQIMRNTCSTARH